MAEPIAAVGQVRWTAKLPLLVDGAAAILVGLFLLAWQRSRALTITGFALVIVGVAFVGYSMKIKNWCVSGHGSAFHSAFSQSFAACARQKGWIEF